MIEKITLENFKGIGCETTIRLGPLTLLFGGNSSGKSTVLHAIAYAKEIFERHFCDADKTVLGGDSLDLGGFTEMVHGHDPKRKIRMRFDFSNEGNIFKHLEGAISDMKKFWIQIVIGIPDNEDSSYPRVLSYQTGSVDDNGDVPFIELEYCPSDSKHPLCLGRVRRLNLELPAIEQDRELFESLIPAHKQFAFPTAEDNFECEDNHKNECVIPAESFVYIFNVKDAMPIGLASQPFLPGEPVPTSSRIPPEDREDQEKDYTVHYHIEHMIFRPFNALSHHLHNAMYIGPIREIPDRNFVLSRITKNPLAEVTEMNVSRWAKGLGAYDILLSLREKEWRQINTDLSGKKDEHLDTGYELVYIPPNYELSYLTEANRERELILPDNGYFSPHFTSWLLSPEFDKKYFPRSEWFGLFDIKRKVLVQLHNVGVGLSQVIPIIIGLAREDYQLQLLEQPELHLHPKQQAAVGDLLIHAVKSGRQIIAETHSIHLVLRILRRIQENFKRGFETSESFVHSNLMIQFADATDGRTSFLEIAIGKDGEFLQPWPDDFFDQEFKERFQLC